MLHDALQASMMLGVNGLSRFGRDVLDGIVDIGLPGTPFATDSEAVSVNDLIAAIKQLIEWAHGRAMKIF